MYHGWNDPDLTLGQHRLLPKRAEDDEPREDSVVHALYMAPGMEHCAGGPGPAAFGQLGIPTSKGPKYGVFDALVDWVRKVFPRRMCSPPNTRRRTRC